MSSALGSMAARASAVTLGGQAVKTLLLLVNLVVLGRLLDPDEFGVVALGLAVVGAADLLRDLGLSTAAIRAPNLSRAEASNLFWINSGLGLALSALAAFAARPLAEAFDEQALQFVVYGLCGVFFLNGLQTQFQAQLARQYRFAWLAGTEVFAQFLGLVAAVCLALNGAGYWSLVGLQLTIAAVLLCSRALISRWRPSRYDRTCPIGQFIKFGASLVVGQLLGFAANSTPTIALGAVASSTQVGLYSRSAQTVSIPINQGFGPLTNVVVASLGRASGASYARLSRAVMTLSSTTGVFIYSLLFTIAPTAVPTLLGPAWESAVPIVQILTLGAIFQTLTFPYYWLFISLNRARALLKYNLASKGIVIIFACAGANWGTTGVATGFAVGLAASLPICLAWFKDEASIDHRVLAGLTGRLSLLAVASVALPKTLSLLFASNAAEQQVITIASWLVAFTAFWILLCARRDAAVILSALRRILPN